MSLDDRTNEIIQLAMNDGEIYVDVDSDSSIWPEPWVWIADQYDEDRPALRLTLEEAGKLHDRLGLILGRSGRITDAELERERERQVALGYTREHDVQHGPEHLLRWSIEYGKRGESIKAHTLTLAALEVLVPA